MTPPEQHNFTPDKGNPFGWDEERRNHEAIALEKDLLKLPVHFWPHVHPAEFKVLKSFINTLLEQREESAYERGYNDGFNSDDRGEIEMRGRE